YVFIFYAHAHHLDLPSFPTRRSSDLARRLAYRTGWPARPRSGSRAGPGGVEWCLGAPAVSTQIVADGCRGEARGARAAARRARRSEEHTSELQSQSNLVCRLLLEKKK